MPAAVNQEASARHELQAADGVLLLEGQRFVHGMMIHAKRSIMA
jgi:hypothetical protein